MIKIISENGIELFFKDRSVFSHSKSHPFATSIKKQTTYSSDRGDFTSTEKILEVTPLTEFNLVSYSNFDAIIEFYFDEIRLKLCLTICDDALKIVFESSQDCSYKFVFNACPNEGIFGGGEQYRKLNLKGEKVVNFVTEHTKFSVLEEKSNPNVKYVEKEHKDIGTYAPMTTFVSSEHYAMRFDVNCDGISDFSQQNQSVFDFNVCPKSLLFVVKDTFALIGQRLNKDIVNNEYLPDWAYDGMILGVQGGIDVVEKKAIKMIDDAAKICGVWCQDWSGKKITSFGSQVYWNWQYDTNLYHDLPEKIQFLKSKGVHFLAYINPYLVIDSVLYNYCKSHGYLIKKQDGSVYHIKTTTFQAGMMDLTNPQMVDFLKNQIIKKNMLDLGIDGYMADFGEYLPVDCVLHNGNPSVLHNYWPTLWAKINREAITEYGNKDVFFFTRSGYNGAQSYTTLMWNGDQHTDFTCDYGLPCVMPATFSLGFSGMTVAHSDIGGFFSFAHICRDSQLFIRWLEMSTFSPLMRSHESIRPQFNTQFDDKEVAPYTAKLSQIHSKLKPYLQDCFETAKKGIPFMRPDFYENNDYSLSKDEYSYFLGSDIIVFPIVTKDAKTRRVFIPKGVWVNMFTKIEYVEGEYELDAILGQPLAFYKSNSKYKDIFDKIK